MKKTHWSIKIIFHAALYSACLLAIGLVLVGCADSSKKAETDTEKEQINTPQETQFKVAMLLPASISDAGWNALAYDGLLAIEKELGAKISHVESRTPADQEEHFRSYATEEYNLIFGHGYEYQDPAKAVASDFPETVFITTSGGTYQTNIAPINFRLEEATYLLGIMAGMMTQTNKVGVIGGQNIPSVNSTFMAFKGGVESVNPDAAVRYGYVGDWENSVKGKELASAQIDEGIDFIFPNADAAGRGVFEAVKAAQTAGKVVYAFGSNRDQSVVSPETVLANAVITPGAFVDVAKHVKEGTFKADKSNPYTYTMSTDNAISMVYNPKLKDKVPEAVQKKIEETAAKILAGELKVPQIDFTKTE